MTHFETFLTIVGCLFLGAMFSFCFIVCIEVLIRVWKKS